GAAMSFFSRLFKSRTVQQAESEESKGRISIAGILRQTGAKVTAARCGVSGCGLSFASLGSITATVPRRQDYILDSGGFCPKCVSYVCPRHAKLIDKSGPFLSKLKMNIPVQEFTLSIFGIGCGKCGTELRRSEEEFQDAVLKRAAEILDSALKEVK